MACTAVGLCGAAGTPDGDAMTPEQELRLIRNYVARAFGADYVRNLTALECVKKLLTKVTR